MLRLVTHRLAAVIAIGLATAAAVLTIAVGRASRTPTGHASDGRDRCIGGLTPDIARSAPSPLDEKPRILWRRSIPTGGDLKPEVVLTKTRMAFTAGTRLYLLDKKANVIKSISDERQEVMSGPVGDFEGDVVFVADSANLLAVDRRGDVLWKSGLDRPIIAGEFLVPNPPLRTPSGELVLAGVDGLLHVIRGQDGLSLSKRFIGVGPALSAAYLAAGTGSDVLISRQETPSQSVSLYRIGLRGDTGPAPFADNGWPATWVIPLGATGAIVYGYSETKSRYGRVSLTVVDTCGNPMWSVSDSRWMQPLVVDSEGSIYVAERDAASGDSPLFVRKYAKGGKSLTQASVPGSVAAAVLGSDQTVLMVLCTWGEGMRTAGVQVIDYSTDLKERWRLDVQGACPVGAALDEGGILFLDRPGMAADTSQLSDVEVVAVQTDSPGVSRSGWPASRHDNSNTGWRSP